MDRNASPDCKDLQDVYVRKRKCKGDERFKEWKGCLIAGATLE